MEEVALAAFEEDEDEVEPKPVLSPSSFVKRFTSLVGVLCLMASASWIENGSTLNAIYLDTMGTLNPKARITKAKMNLGWFFKYYQ